MAVLHRFYCNSSFTLNCFFIWTYVLFQYRAWSRPEYINQTSVSLRTGSEVIDYFADYFGIGYPLPKEGELSVIYRGFYMRAPVLLDLLKKFGKR